MFVASQKASMLGRPGGVGTRDFFLEGETRRDLDGEAGGGGVQGRSLEILGGRDWSRGGELVMSET